MAGKKGRSGRHPKIVVDDSDLVLTKLFEDKGQPLIIDSRATQIISGLADIACTNQEIAAVLGVPRKTFEDFIHKKQNAWLEDIIEDRRSKGAASLRRTQEDVVKERVRTECPDCGKVMILPMSQSTHVACWMCDRTGYFEGKICPRCNGAGVVVVEAFLTECQYCGSREVKHVYMPPDKTMLVWLGKQRLGQTDKNDVKLSGDPAAPVVISTLAEFVKNAAKKTEQTSD